MPLDEGDPATSHVELSQVRDEPVTLSKGPAEHLDTALHHEDPSGAHAQTAGRPDADLDANAPEPPSKRRKLEKEGGETNTIPSERQRGVAPIKAEFLIHAPGMKHSLEPATINDDDAEAALRTDPRDRNSSQGWKKKEKNRGQNKGREFGASRDERGLCQSRARHSEFSPAECQFGDSCKFEHDLRKYLQTCKREDLTTFSGICPVWQVKGICDAGWKCRFVGSHLNEREGADGRKELVLVERERGNDCADDGGDKAPRSDIVNVVSTQAKADLMKRKTPTPKADTYNAWLDESGRKANEKAQQGARTVRDPKKSDDDDSTLQDQRARYIEPPLLPSEKRRIYYGPETPILAPLTTQGNLPFRRICVDAGAQVTFSEMAMSTPLIQGQKSEWTLMKAHRSEMQPPCYSPCHTVKGYENSSDMKFGAQIAGSKPLQVLKATEILTRLCPALRVIDLNCGCPIDLVYRQGAGSALLDNQSKLEKMLRGMNAVSDNIPITVKIRTGTRDGKPTALKLVNRLVYGTPDATNGNDLPSGVAAITLHGRSRQQRYTKNADWAYISECAALIERHRAHGDELADTVREADARDQSNHGGVYFIGNGDCFSHTQYHDHLQQAGVDSVMVARGALIKPWIFEEIAQGQYLDKSATERLAIVEQYARYGLETWGSDEIGVGVTRRFLLEWLSFAYRYVPVGILEYLPPRLQDRPPAWRGRNELETLLGSDHYTDWIKISEMFLGPAHRDFRFEPKHKSNSYEIEAEG